MINFKNNKEQKEHKPRKKNGQRTQGVGWIPRHLETKKGVVPTKCSGELETSDNPEIPE